MNSAEHLRAVWWLLAGTAVWGLSFPVIKAMHELQSPFGSTWFLSCWLLVLRFGVSAVCLLAFAPKIIFGLTRLEWIQAVAISLFAAPGLLLQADGLAATDASTSAFLTQFYCIVLPIWACIVKRRLPGMRLTICTLLVVGGIAILSRLNFKTLHIGPGELKTIYAALFFTGQILVLEMPVFRKNRMDRVSVIMFGFIAILALIPAIQATDSVSQLTASWSMPSVLILLAIIALGCTLFSYTVMNRWQPAVSATEAGLIYSTEPVFASVFALFVPAWIAGLTGINYANETLTPHLLWGGGLVLLATVLLQLPERRKIKSGT
jgi:drug/metabolite transporter (DMT)-like permease